jgi:hypothetical protein
MNNRPTSPEFSVFNSDDDPPPPVAPPQQEQGVAVFDAEDNSLDLEEEYEHTLSEHEDAREPSYTEPFIEEYGSTVRSKNNADEATKQQKPFQRKGVLVAICFLLVIVVIGIGVTVSLSNKNPETELTTSSAIGFEGGSTDEPTPAPYKEFTTYTPSPVADEYSSKAPTSSTNKEETMESLSTSSNEEYPTTAPTPYKSHNTTDIPSKPGDDDSDCTDKISVDQTCYEYGDMIQIDYVACKAKRSDWVAFYVEGGADKNGYLRLGPDFKYWEYVCGGQEERCEEPLDVGSLSIKAKVRPGTYQFYLISGGEPYQSSAYTQSFNVSDEC